MQLQSDRKKGILCRHGNSPPYSPWFAIQALLELIGELHACHSVSMVVTSRIKPVSMHMLYLPPLDAGSADSLLRLHCGAQADALQPEAAEKLMRLCSCNALLLRLLGAMISSERCHPQVS